MKPQPQRQAFSLIELLVVMAIVSMLISLTVSAIGGALGSYRLTIGADSISGCLASARQLAASKNKVVEFRLIRPTGEEWRYFQLLIENDQTGKLVPHGNILQLPDGIRLLSDATYGGMLTLPSQTLSSDSRYAGGYYTFIRFNPGGGVQAVTSGSNGTVIAPVGSSNNFLTLAADRGGSTLPPNWIALRVDGKTGTVSRFQP